MILHDHEIAVCSWSLRTTNAWQLISQVRSLGLDHVQLALFPLVALDPHKRELELATLRESGLQLTGGMLDFPGEDYSSIARICGTGGFAPDETWEERRQLVARAIPVCRDLGITSITTHVGFIPRRPLSCQQRMVDRIRAIADLLAEADIRLLMETGQETAIELREFIALVDRSSVGVNFDPANMILYGAGDPIEAIEILAAEIGHVHVKDAIASDRPGKEWGQEVCFGAGSVGPARFLTALKLARYTGPLAIEREAGESRAADVIKAVDCIRQAWVGAALRS